MLLQAVTARRPLLAVLVVLGAVAGCSADAGDDDSSGRGPAMTGAVAVCLGEGAGLPPTPTLEVRQDGAPVGEFPRAGVGGWFEVRVRSGDVEVVVDDEVVERGTVEPGGRLEVSLGDCVPTPPA